MRVDKHQVNAAFAFAGAAVLWPSLLCAVTEALATPLQRAMNAAWCGGASQAAALLGHCPACWAGSAAFMAAAVLSLTLLRPAPHAAASAPTASA
jgi:hypothetical protein